MILELIRDDDPANKHNWGKLFVDRLYLGETIEDPDHYLEAGGEKEYGNTAIPRGRYRVTRTYSPHFKRILPEVHDVPDYVGIRIHGANDERDVLGCIGLGQTRTLTGIANCAGVNERLNYTLLAAEQRGEEVWIEVS